MNIYISAKNIDISYLNDIVMNEGMGELKWACPLCYKVTFYVENDLPV